jgi:polar amino acid transport system substrate-binding protein
MKYLLFLSLLLPSYLKANSKLILYTENEPPFSMRKNELKIFGPDDPIWGISVDILNTLFSRVRIPQVMKIDIWDRGYNLALTKENFGIFSTFRTEEREKLFKWVGPLVNSDWVLVGKETFGETIREISDPILKNLRIGTLKGSALETFLKSKKITPLVFPSGFECALALNQDKIDLWATGEPVAVYYSKRIRREKIKVVFPLKVHQFMYLALNIKAQDNLVTLLNRELGIMNRDGTIKGIYRRYQGF